LQPSANTAATFTPAEKEMLPSGEIKIYNRHTICGSSIAIERRKNGDFIVTDFLLQQSRKPGCCGGAKRANQIIGVEVLQFFTHSSSLLLKPLLRNIS
jgi:hypothetical protein